MHFSFIGKAQFRQATLFCDSSYYSLFIAIFVVLEAEIMQNRQGKCLNLPLIYVIEV